ncbi:MAG: peroxidase [Acidobacteria bacterium]|nr:peroxidase [Acidobacteriota bacterium]
MSFAAGLDRRKPWHKRGLWLGATSILATRVRLRHWNLVDTGSVPGGSAAAAAVSPAPDERHLRARAADGRFNDLGSPDMGRAGTLFGRNMPLQRCFPAGDASVPRDLLEPNPRAISEQLLAREGGFMPVPFLNLLAAAWLQFMIHDWMGHDNEKDQPIEFAVPPGSDWGEPTMSVRRTRRDPARSAGPPVYGNVCTHWWDGSQLYGNSAERERELRSGVDGKLRLDDGGLLPLERKAHGEVDLTGVNENWWVGLSVMHTLFAREHNRICEMLKNTPRARREGWDDDRLFDQARLVNAALLAKIHTVEWTPAILPHRTTAYGLKGNWWGLFGKRGSRLFRHVTRWDLLRGIPGSHADHHAAPYAITDDFTAVYRMHALLPDSITFRDSGDDRELRRLGFLEATEQGVRPLVRELGFDNAVYSLGREHPGMLALGNFPDSLRNFTRPNGNRIDLAAVDILRDRERGVPRYNEFREFLGLPRVRSFEDLLGAPKPGDAVARARYDKYLPRLKQLYGDDIDRVDLLIGLYAEPLIDGFGFSETAFFLFILMASRRLKSDRFLTDDYRPEVYTPEGIRWIEDTTMLDVLRRNVPALAPALAGLDNAFNPWNVPAAH